MSKRLLEEVECTCEESTINIVEVKAHDWKYYIHLHEKVGNVLERLTPTLKEVSQTQ